MADVVPGLTDQVRARVAAAPHARARELSDALVRHLHAFIAEVEPSVEEWDAAIDFLTRVGQISGPTRQEFILLSDTLGASMLVDELNAASGATTESTILGPFYVRDAPAARADEDLGTGLPGERLLIDVVLRDTSGASVADACVDVWQSNSEGFYDVQLGDRLRLRARFASDADGRVRCWSVVPSSYPIPEDGPVGDMLRAQGRHPYRPAHVHFRIAAPGHRELITHLFVADDEYLDSDVAFGVLPGLVVELQRRPADDRSPVDYAVLRYTFVLAGP